jgi:hypothetical protein
MESGARWEGFGEASHDAAQTSRHLLVTPLANPSTQWTRECERIGPALYNCTTCKQFLGFPGPSEQRLA